MLAKNHADQGRIFLRVGVTAGLLAILFTMFPAGDGQAKLVADHQPVAFAAMEGLFDTTQGAPIAFVGQPDVEHLRLDNPIEAPYILSFLTYRHWNSEVKGLTVFPRDTWPDNIPLLYYSYHIMVGLGTIMAAVMIIAALLLWRGRLFSTSAVLWALLLSVPMPYIATIAGWLTTELGRQPWLIYGLLRTAHGASPLVSAGNSLFTLLGFMGMYLLLGIFFLFIVAREIVRGPVYEESQGEPEYAPSAKGEGVY
jgi:cytochrome d ubiquinol oxidase subunit I